MDGVERGCSAKTADPSAAAGMTRGKRLRSATVATWMDRVEGGYSAKIADPSAAAGMATDKRPGLLIFLA
jgi:hypothetical protein